LSAITRFPRDWRQASKGSTWSFDSQLLGRTFHRLAVGSTKASPDIPPQGLLSTCKACFIIPPLAIHSRCLESLTGENKVVYKVVLPDGKGMVDISSSLVFFGHLGRVILSGFSGHGDNLQTIKEGLKECFVSPTYASQVFGGFDVCDAPQRRCNSFHSRT